VVGKREKFSGDFQMIADDVNLGRDVRLSSFINLYGCEIGDETTIGAFVEVQRGAVIGARCKISSHTFICDGVTIEDGCFVGHGVTFINDRYPRAVTDHGDPCGDGDWEKVSTTVRQEASIGSGATIMGGVEVGAHAVVAAGAVVIHDVAPGTLVMGVPARSVE